MAMSQAPAEAVPALLTRSQHLCFRTPSLDPPKQGSFLEPCLCVSSEALNPFFSLKQVSLPNIPCNSPSGPLAYYLSVLRCEPNR